MNPYPFTIALRRKPLQTVLEQLNGSETRLLLLAIVSADSNSGRATLVYEEIYKALYLSKDQVEHALKTLSHKRCIEVIEVSEVGVYLELQAIFVRSLEPPPQLPLGPLMPAFA